MSHLELLPYQYDFLQLDDPNAALIAGVGTGKTLTLAYMAINLISKYPKSKGMIVANTYSQLINSTLEPLFTVLEELSIPYKKNISGKYITILNTKIYVYCLENYDNIRGIEVGWIMADELAFQKDRQAYDTIKTRLRCKYGPLYFRGFTTKNGFNWFYELYASPSKTNDFKVIEAQTIDNTYLPPQYLEDLLEDYGSVDAPMYRQEVLNHYVNLLQGSVYWSFNRDKHTKKGLTLNPNKQVYICVDFNIDNMNAVLLQLNNNNELHVIKEISLKDADSNTFTLRDRLAYELRDCPYRSIIADSTGAARKTSSAKSDHELLKEYGFKIERTTNPLIRDRQNAVNKQFNLNKLYIDDSCKNLIKELETLASREKEGDKAHISVAMGYGINFLRPVKVRKPSTQYNPYK